MINKKTMKTKKSRKLSINIFFSTLVLFPFTSYFANAQERVIDLKKFDKVIVSPHIQVKFEQGEKESIIIEDISVPFEKFNIEQSVKSSRPKILFVQDHN